VFAAAVSQAPMSSMKSPTATQTSAIEPVRAASFEVPVTVVPTGKVKLHQVRLNGSYAAIPLPAIAGGVVVGRLGLARTFELFGSLVAAIALVVAFQAWRTRPQTYRAHHCVAYQATR
jgi:hypothetical protein